MQNCTFCALDWQMQMNHLSNFEYDFTGSNKDHAASQIALLTDDREVSPNTRHIFLENKHC